MAGKFTPKFKGAEKRIWIEEQAIGKIQNFETLINGTSPEELKDIFFKCAGLI